MIDIYIEHCDFCGTCVGVCANDAIILGRAVIEIDRDFCKGCGDCVDICPLGALERRQ